jgi:two-component system sensor histidine kinase KdpD
LPAAAAIEPLRYAASVGFVGLALGLALLIDRYVDIENISLVFLAAVLASAVRFGLGPSICAVLLSVLCYNFFFLPPLYTFTIANPQNVVALFFFLIVAVLTSSLTARTRTQAAIAQRQARTTAELHGFSKKLAGIAKLDDLLWATAHQIATMLKVEVVILIPEGDGIAVRAGFPPEDQLDEADLAAAKWCWDHNQPAGRGADTLPGARRLFLPLRTAGRSACSASTDGPRDRCSRPTSGGCSTRWPIRQRWRSSAPSSPLTSTRRACWRRRSACARRC